MRRGRAGPPMAAQWDPKASKMVFNGTPKAPKMSPRTPKNAVWRRQSLQNGLQNYKNEALNDPKASKSTQTKMTNLTLNSKH